MPIYRGMTGGNFFYKIRGLDSSEERMSPNAIENIYNLLLSNLPSWSKYPKRNKSIICSTDRNIAVDYGTLYCIFPYNNTKIGLVPDSDIWYSFGKYGCLSDFNYYIMNILETFSKTPTDKIFKNYNQLLKCFDEVDKTKKENKKIAYDYIKKVRYIFDLLNSCKYFDIPEKKFIDCLNTALDPEHGGFDIITTKNKYPYNREVWIDDYCIAVDYNVFYNESFLELYNELKNSL